VNYVKAFLRLFMGDYSEVTTYTITKFVSISFVNVL